MSFLMEAGPNVFGRMGFKNSYMILTNRLSGCQSKKEGPLLLFDNTIPQMISSLVMRRSLEAHPN